MLDLLSNIKQYLNKGVLTVALIAGLVISIIIGMNVRSTLNLTRSELSSYQSMYSLVEKEKHRLDSLIDFYRASITLRDSTITVLNKKISGQVASIVLLENSIKDIRTDLEKVTADSSYKYINNRIPAVTEKKYGFDSVQVKSIHYTFLERDKLSNLNLQYSVTLGTLLSASSLKDTQINELKELNNLHISKEAILRKERESDQQALEDMTKSLKQQKRQKNIIIGGVATTAAIIIIKSISQ